MTAAFNWNNKETVVTGKPKAIRIRNGRRRLTVEVNERLDTPRPEVAGGLERGVLGDVRHDETNGRAAPVCPVDLLPHLVHPGQRRQGRRRRAGQQAEQQDQRQAGELHGYGWRGQGASKRARSKLRSTTVQEDGAV